MADPQKNELSLEIGHVLFIDIVGYTKLLINEQRALREALNQIVRQTEQFREADATGRLIKSPSGDGMALIFRNSPEEPVECAIEIGRGLKAHPNLPLRMGIHSGPASAVVDVNDQTGVAGAGINMAQRVMDCGDAGHILLSKHVAEDLEQDGHWQPHLHDLGECEVKHGIRVGVVNLYSDEFGNSALPGKFAAQRKHQMRTRWIAAAIGAAAVTLIAAALFSLSTRSTSPLPEKSIAVLPFDNLSRDPDNAFFADGVQDAILTNLAKVADLKVISRTSVMAYKSGIARNIREIGKQLEVAHLLEGSVQRAAGKVRVNAQLIDARNDAHLWAQTYDRDLADVFAIQSEIAKAIADQLQARLSPAEKEAVAQRPTADVVAFEQYSKAKTMVLSATAATSVTGGELREAIALLTAASARDPAFHAAYCLLTYANDQLYSQGGYDHTPERLTAAEEALSRATQLRPDSAETHLARAQHIYYALRDYKGARAELDLAAQGLPNDPRIPELTGYILRREGKGEEALGALQQAVLLDPRNVYVLQQMATSYLGFRRYAEAAGALDRALQIQPDDLVLGVIRAMVDLQWHADPGPMCRFVDRVRMERPTSIPLVADNWFQCSLVKRDSAAAERALVALGENPCWGEGPILLSHRFGEGLLARAMHDEARARRAFTADRVEQEQAVQKQKDYAPALCVLGLIDAALGNKEAALEEGRRATELLPVSKDALNGPVVIAYFAMIAAWTGEKDLVLQQLNAAIEAGAAPGCTHYGILKTFPFWDPLRGDPRFEKIVASLAPKEAAAK